MKISFREYFNKGIRINQDNISSICSDPISIPLAYLILRYSRITPNMITVMSLFFGLVAAIVNFLSFKYYPALFYFIAFILDLTDGKVARARGMSSPLGKTIDIVADRTVFSILSLSYIYFFLRTTDWLETFLLATYIILYLYLEVVLYFVVIYSVETGRIDSSSRSPKTSEGQNVMSYLISYLSIKRWLPTRLGGLVIIFVVAPLTGLYVEMYVFAIVSLLLIDQVPRDFGLVIIRKLFKN